MIKSKHIISILFVFFVHSFFGQIFSKKKVLKSSNKIESQQNNTSLLEQIDYAKRIFTDSTSKATGIVENVLYTSLKQKKKLEEGVAYKTLGEFNQVLSSFELALYNYDKALPILKKLNRVNLLEQLYQSSAICHYNLKNFQEAINNYETANQIASSKGNTFIEVKNRLEIGNLHVLKREYNDAQKQYVFCESISKDKGYKTQLVKAKIGLGEVYLALKKYNQAEVKLKEASKLAESIENDALANQAFDLLAKVEEKQNHTEDNIAYQQKAYSFNQSRGNLDDALRNSSNMANTLLEQNRTTEAMEVLKNNTELAKQTSDVKVKKDFYKALSTLYEKQGKKEEAEIVNKQYKILEDSLKQTTKNKELALQNKTEMLSNAQNRLLLMEKDKALNQKEILLLRQQQILQESTIKKQEIITYSLAIGLFVILILSFFIYKNNKEKQTSNQLLVLKSLRNQMNPHFIFNSLNSVNSFIAKQDERSANKYLAEFSKLMREVLEYSQEDFIPLAKEVEILKLYLNLEHFRFKNDFDFTFHVDKNINLDDYQIPPMLLQPFVENAIWHGLRYKEDKGNLAVSFIQKMNCVEVVIKDDGIGREKSKLVKTQNQKKMKSTGLKNVESRLEIIKNVFKKDLEITIDDLNKQTKEGTLVTIRLYA